nr:hypothetical protein CFP56_79000 [Quercus suber]
MFSGYQETISVVQPGCLQPLFAMYTANGRLTSRRVEGVIKSKTTSQQLANVATRSYEQRNFAIAVKIEFLLGAASCHGQFRSNARDSNHGGPRCLALRRFVHLFRISEEFRSLMGLSSAVGAFAHDYHTCRGLLTSHVCCWPLDGDSRAYFSRKYPASRY